MFMKIIPSKQLQLKSMVMCVAGLCMGLALAQDAPWHLGTYGGQVSAPSAINTLLEKPGPHRVVVAVIDSGVLSGHPSLAGQLLPGYDMVSASKNLRSARSPDFSPDERGARCGARLMSSGFRTHGTEVASLVAGNGEKGVLGVNPAAQILPVRVYGACGISRTDLLDAIKWAAGLSVDGVPDNPYPAKIINLSMAGGYAVCDAELQALIDRLVRNQKFVVAAAGNNFHKSLHEPANCNGVISVGALSAENRIEVYTAMDPRTLIYAPGGGGALLSHAAWAENKMMVATYTLDFFGNERPTSSYSGVGTSYAAPVVSGFISLWLSHHPDKNLADFTTDMARFVRPVEPIKPCAECVPYGLVNTDRLSLP